MQVTVTKIHKCDDCTQFNSSSDCKATKFRCTWTEKTATKSRILCQIYNTCCYFYIILLKIETTSCAQTFGCALVDGKCTHFTGYSAYVKTTHSDCQTKSTCVQQIEQMNLNVLDILKINVKLSVAQGVHTSVSTSSIDIKHKLKGETCRDYICTEADSSLTTDVACSTWLSDCKTTGAGCIDSITLCASYQGTSETYPKMKGSDGNYELNPDGSNNFRARLCTGADQSITGKGYIAIRGACSTYDGNASTTDAECGTWKTGYKSNGKQYVDLLGACSSYDGTTTTCLGLIESDGNCKGTSTTAKCALKDCVLDGKETIKTDAECQKIQSYCKTTGKGCVATLAACSSYSYTDDGTSCNSWYGSDGRCKPGTAGKCAARVCTEALTSLTTNKYCDDYKSGCVTTGVGCVSTTVCQDTVKQVTCEGTSNCGWNSICTTNCSYLLAKSICKV